MEMFEEGGLKDEGNTIDPVSGNDVPPGSTQEEVRDDIPAQLSEGEFVFPADVVRYLGLEKLMTLRQEAKMGLKTMEDMGQMGNSEEASMPDDMPFDINDIDMDDEQEYNSEDMDMAQGGVVYAANGFAGTTTNTNQLGSKASSFGNTATRTPQPKTYTPPPIPTAAPTGGFKYGATKGASENKLNFDNLFKDTGAADEYRTYVNDAGAEIQVPFKNGKVMTGFTIPEGYKLKTEKLVTPKIQTARAKSTRPTQQDDGEGTDDLTSLGGARADIGGVTMAVSYGLDGTVSVANVADANRTGRAEFNQLTPKAAAAIKTQAYGQIAQIAKVVGLKSFAVSALAEKLGVKVPGVDKLQSMIDKSKAATVTLSKMEPGDIFDMGQSELDAKFSDRSGAKEGTKEFREEKDMRSIQGGLQYGRGTQINRGLDDDFVDSLGNIPKGITKDSFEKVDTSGRVRQGDVQQIDREEYDGDPTGGFSDSYDSPTESGSASVSSSGYGSSGGAGDFNIGGLAGKKKQKIKPKKMKRGGLASR